MSTFRTSPPRRSPSPPPSPPARKQEAQAPAPRPVIAQVVGAKPAEGANVYSGEVRARYENDLAFRVGGKVVARFVDVGATVKKGEQLARLDPQDAQLGVESARSAARRRRGRPRARQGRARALPRALSRRSS